VGSVEINELKASFEKIAGDSGFVTPPQLEEVLKLAASEAMIVPEASKIFARRLFKVFDTNGDGKVDENEFLVGMAVICAGTFEEKLELTFHAYCDQKNPYITRAGMYAMLKAAYTHSLELLAQNEEESPKVERLKREAADTVIQRLLSTLNRIFILYLFLG